MPDMVNHPKHYNSHPCGVEAIDVIRTLPFSLGNAIKYLWRAGHKGSLIEDFKKAVWYLEDAICHDDLKVFSGFAPGSHISTAAKWFASQKITDLSVADHALHGLILQLDRVYKYDDLDVRTVALSEMHFTMGALQEYLSQAAEEEQ